MSCFNCRILVKVLAVVGFYVKSKFSCCVVPNSVFNLYGTIFKNHTNPLTVKILINLKLGKTVACDLGAGAFGYSESQQIVECDNLGHRFYAGVVAWLNPINIFPILFGVVVLNTTQQQVLGYSINGRSHSVYGPQSLVGTVCDHKIFVANWYLAKILICQFSVCCHTLVPFTGCRCWFWLFAVEQVERTAVTDWELQQYVVGSLKIVLQGQESICKKALTWAELYTIQFSWAQLWIRYLVAQSIFTAE